MQYIGLIVGFVLLIKCADWFVDGSSNLAKALGVPTLVIGLTIVAFGTSAPEAAVSISASVSGQNEIAVGNAVGSSICNLLLVLGASAAVFPMAAPRSVLKKDYMFAVMAAAAGGVLIYNISMINIRERVNEFGTLLVLGMSEKEISGFLAVEQGFYFILGILAGIRGSRGIKTLVEKVVISDSYSIDMHVSIWSYMGAFFICLAITALAGRGEMRFVRNIRLTEVLKERA